MDDHDNTGLWLASFLIAGALVGTLVGTAAIFYNIGFDSGVRAHANGTYVVVELPNGTSAVCRVMRKEPPDAPR